MATLTFNGESFTVAHAVKGTNYVHGYNANGECIVAIEGINDFGVVSYNDTYMTPDKCLDEECNTVRYVNGKLVNLNGTEVFGLKTDRWTFTYESGTTETKEVYIK